MRIKTPKKIINPSVKRINLYEQNNTIETAFAEYIVREYSFYIIYDAIIIDDLCLIVFKRSIDESAAVLNCFMFIDKRIVPVITYIINDIDFYSAVLRHSSICHIEMTVVIKKGLIFIIDKTSIV